MQPPIGHIRNRAATQGDRATAAAAPGVILRSPENYEELDDAIAEMRDAGVRRLIIDGGDGTVRSVLSRAVDCWGGAPPPFAIIAHGNTNLIARKVGALPQERIADFSAKPDDALRRMDLKVLRADRQGEAPLRGFILGAGAYETATRFAQEELAMRHGVQVALAVLRLLRSAELRRPVEIGFAPDGADEARQARTLVGMTTLPRPLIWRFDPFWGEASRPAAGPIRWLDVAAPAPLLPLAAPFIAFGRPRKWMSGAYRSGVCAAADLCLDGHFVMDGERFLPGSGGRVRVSAGETATFLSTP